MLSDALPDARGCSMPSAASRTWNVVDCPPLPPENYENINDEIILKGTPAVISISVRKYLDHP